MRERALGLLHTATLFLVTALLACTPTPDRPDIFLISIDTLRADHLTGQGYPFPTTVALEAWFENAAVFENAQSTSSWTAPALASLMTSLPPHEHGMQNGLAPMFLTGEDTVVAQSSLSETVTTLAELLSAAGYATYGFSTNPHASQQFGFDQGFDHFAYLRPANPDPATGRVYADAEETRRRVLAELRDAPDQPLFVWVHVLDPHLPYRPRPAWIEAHGPRDPNLPPLDTAVSRIGELRMRPYLQRKAIVALYDGEIDFASRQLAALLDEIGPRPDAVVVLTSDHGESIYEHQLIGHGKSLYEPELRVPLLLRMSQGSAQRIEERVSLLDVMPTLLALAGVDAPPGIAGRSLLPLLDGAAFEQRTLFAELLRGRAQVHSANRGRWKLIVDDRAGTRELYDLAVDPEERHDVAGRNPEVVAELEAALADQRAQAKGRDTEIREVLEVTPDIREALEALGYAEPGDEAAPSDEATRSR